MGKNQKKLCYTLDETALPALPEFGTGECGEPCSDDISKWCGKQDWFTNRRAVYQIQESIHIYDEESELTLLSDAEPLETSGNLLQKFFAQISVLSAVAAGVALFVGRVVAGRR